MKSALVLMLVVACAATATAGPLVCGDIDHSGDGPDIADLVYLANYMFKDGPEVAFPAEADCNGDGTLDISDLVCWVNFMFKEGPLGDCGIIELPNHQDNSGDCVSQPVGKDDRPPRAAAQNGYMTLEVVDNDLIVRHFEALYQCCLMYQVQYYQCGQMIVGFEIDTGAQCDCICYFNLESILYDLEPGSYVFTLIGINHDVIGHESFTVPGGGGPALIDYGDSGCLTVEPPGEPVELEYLLSGNTLGMAHLNAYLDCAAAIVVEFAIVGDTLRFYERDVYTGSSAPCMCFYRVYAAVAGIAPGDYVAELYQQSNPEAAIVLLDRREITLSDIGPALVCQNDSGCVELGRDDPHAVTFVWEDGVLTMHHPDGFFNCGGVIDVSFEAAGDTLRFYEFNISDDWAYCMCYFDISATAGGITPGTYVIEVYARDWPEDPITLIDRQTLTLE